MTRAQLEKHLLDLPGAVVDYPFGPTVAVYKVFIPNKSSDSHLDAAQGSSEERAKRRNTTLSERQNVTDTAMRQEPAGATGFASGQGKAVRGDWKMFALMAEKSTPLQISLKCDPQLAALLREKYETILAGYHLNKKHWNTILLTGQVPDDEVRDLIRHSYELVKS